MRFDDKYSHIYQCPITKSRVTFNSHMDRDGVCSECGHDSGSTITHAVKVVGKWSYPSFVERINGRKAEFIKT